MKLKYKQPLKNLDNHCTKNLQKAKLNTKRKISQSSLLEASYSKQISMPKNPIELTKKKPIIEKP